MNAQEKIINSMQKDSTYTFQSVMADYEVNGSEAFNILDYLTKEGLIAEKNGTYVVIADESKLSSLKIDDEDDENEDFDDNEDREEDKDNDTTDNVTEAIKRINAMLDDDDDDDSWGIFFDVAQDEEMDDDLSPYSKVNLIKNISFSRLPQGESIYIDAYGVKKSDTDFKHNIKHSIKEFLNNILEQRTELMRVFFNDLSDYRLYLENKKSLDIRNCVFELSSSKISYNVKWNKPIAKQRKVYNALLEELTFNHSVVLVIELHCKEKYRRKFE